MTTSPNNIATTVSASGVRFEGDVLCVVLSDGRELRVRSQNVPWLKWLANATPVQREKWSLEPGGFAIFWDELDDGFEVCHLLDLRPLG